ncbi:MAG: hypothetical protein K6G00_03005 [Treponema sp.]|nr:hypothetical protein [Treponema sp.]
MNFLKKYISHSIFLLISTISCIYAIDIEYGGLSTSTLSAEGDSIEASAKTNLNTKAREDLTGWIRFPITKNEKLRFAGQATISTTYLQRYKQARENKIGIDLDLFKISYIEKTGEDSTSSVSFGRFGYSHLTNVVFSQNNDGILFRYDSPKVKLGLYGGYTGLLNQQNVKILNEDGDNYRKIDEDLKWYEHLYEWADPYVTTSVVMSFPYLFLNQTVAFEISSFMGTKGPAYDDIELEYNRYYATLSFSGPLAQRVSYAIATTMFTEKFNHLGNLTQLSFYYQTDFKNALISLAGVYASGNGNGPFSRFMAFTSSSATYALDAPEYSGLVKIGTSVSLKPLPNLYTSAGADVVFLCPNNTIEHDGWQWNAVAKLQCTNDFSITLTEYRYYSNDSTRDNGGASLKVSLSF